MLHRATGAKGVKRVERPEIELPNDTIEFNSGEDELKLPGTAQVAAGRRTPPSRGFRLDAGAVKLEHGEDLFGHTGFTIMIDFCRETAEDEGYLISFEGSFSLTIEREVLIGWVATDRGSRTVRAPLARQPVGDWHRAALTFCGRTGRVQLYLDGRRMAGVADLAGAEQAGNFFADLCIGHRHGNNFSGLLDNFKFLDQPLGREDLPPL